MKGPKSIRALFSFPGFVAASALKGVFGDRYARVMVLRRRKKLRSAPAAAGGAPAGMTSRRSEFVTWAWPSGASTSSSIAGASTVPDAAPCS